jgi:hypothetical protein
MKGERVRLGTARRGPNVLRAIVKSSIGVEPAASIESCGAAKLAHAIAGTTKNATWLSN